MQATLQKQKGKGQKKKSNPSSLYTAKCTSSVVSRYWKLEENESYVQFLKDHKRSFQNEKKRRSLKIFLQMSLYIGSKTTQQCRTHHQKMNLKYGGIEGIIGSLVQDFIERKKMKSENEIVIKKTKQFQILGYAENLFKVKLFTNKLRSW